MPDTLGGSQDKRMYIDRHFGLLCWARGDFNNAIGHLTDSAETYRRRRSVNGLLRTLVMLAECFYEVDRTSEIVALCAELDDLATRSAIDDAVARWRVIEGHLLLDEAVELGSDLGPTVARYVEAMTAALGWSSQTLDVTVGRVVYKLGHLSDDGHTDIALFVAKSLSDAWRGGTLDGTPLVSVERERRGERTAEPGGESGVLGALGTVGCGAATWPAPAIWDFL
jgi:hypothetical protein